MVETELSRRSQTQAELFAQTYNNFGLATVRYPVLEVTATVVCRVETERRRTCRVVTW